MNDEDKREESKFSDNYFNVVNLTMEEQSGSMNLSSYFEKLKARALRQNKPDIVTDAPLTTDIFARGYPATDKELDTIRKINYAERKLLEGNPSLQPSSDVPTKYFIVEDGRVFKTSDGGLFFGLDTDSMQWEPDQAFMGIMYEGWPKRSELINFRDYYFEKPKNKQSEKESSEERRGPR